jgi:hypothetical protein
MDCQNIRELTSEYIDHLLGEEQRRAYVDHLSACAACRAYLAETRGAVGELRALGAPPLPGGLAESTLRAIDRTAEPRLAVVGRPPRRWLRPVDPRPAAFLKRFLAEYEFRLISYGVGMVASFAIFTSVLIGLQPLADLTREYGARPATIWITTRQADAMGQELGPRLTAVAYTIPKVSEQGGLPQFAARANSPDDIVVLADVGVDGRASIVEVLSGPEDPHFVGELAVALNRPVFVPARAVSGRPVRSRVVLLLQHVDVVG